MIFSWRNQVLSSPNASKKYEIVIGRNHQFIEGLCHAFIEGIRYSWERKKENKYYPKTPASTVLWKSCLSFIIKTTLRHYKVSLNREGHRWVTKTGTLGTVQAEGHGYDDPPFLIRLHSSSPLLVNLLCSWPSLSWTEVWIVKHHGCAIDLCIFLQSQGAQLGHQQCIWSK
jgi:hypothetical protein